MTELIVAGIVSAFLVFGIPEILIRIERRRLAARDRKLRELYLMRMELDHRRTVYVNLGRRIPEVEKQLQIAEMHLRKLHQLNGVDFS